MKEISLQGRGHDTARCIWSRDVLTLITSPFCTI